MVGEEQSINNADSMNFMAAVEAFYVDECVFDFFLTIVRQRVHYMKVIIVYAVNSFEIKEQR